MVTVTEHKWWISASFERFSDFREAQTVFQRRHPQEDIIRKRKGYDEEKWDGNIKFWKPGNREKTLLVRRGFSGRLRQYLDKEGYDYEWNEKSSSASDLVFDPNLLHGVELDDIQQEALRAVVSNKRCDIELKTGSGKTEIFLCAIASYLEKFPKGKVLVILPKRALLNEAYKRALKRLPHMADKFGLLGDGNFKLNQVLFTTPKSIAAERRDTFSNETLLRKDEVDEWKKDVGLMVLDEVHHAKATGWKNIISDIGSDYCWGFSGKVTYMDDIKTMEIEEIFGEPVYIGGSVVRRVPVIPIFYSCPSWKKKFKEEGLFTLLVDQCPVLYKTPEGWREGMWRGKDEFGNLPELSGTVGIYDKSGEVMLSPQPDSEDVVYWRPFDIGVMEFEPAYDWAIDIADRSTNLGEPWLISARRKRQLNTLEAKVRKKLPNVKVGRVDGSMSGKDQLSVYNALKSGELQGIVCQYTVVSEGVDIPNLRHFIKLDNISSEQALEQQKGRVERAFEGKDVGYIHIPVFSHHLSLHKSATQIFRYYSTIMNPKRVRLK